jgi:DNA-binding PadR family transcriptional regulator
MVYLLFALLEGDKHGYAVKQRAEELSDGVVRLGPGTLYATIQKAEDVGLIEEVPPPADAVEHAQRKYYALTANGRATLRADVERLGALVDGARAAFGGG